MGRPPVYLVWVLPSAMLRTAACRSGSITGDASFARPPVPRAHVGQEQAVAKGCFQEPWVLACSLRRGATPTLRCDEARACCNS